MSHLCLKYESTSRCFQQWEGPSRGLLRDCENQWIVCSSSSYAPLLMDSWGAVRRWVSASVSSVTSPNGEEGCLIILMWPLYHIWLPTNNFLPNISTENKTVDNALLSLTTYYWTGLLWKGGWQAVRMRFLWFILSRVQFHSWVEMDVSIYSAVLWTA